MNKRGGAGKTIALWVATIVIVIILLLFIFGSGVIRQIDKSKGGLKVYGDKDTGLNNLESYMKNYKILISEREKKEIENG